MGREVYYGKWQIKAIMRNFAAAVMSCSAFSTEVTMTIAIAAVPFFLRMWEQQRADQYINQFEEEEDEESEETGNRKKKASPYMEEGTIGIVEIPELKIKYPVFEGTGAVQLNEGIGHMESSAPLCDKGNCVL